jgi:hypothetical protein
MYSQPPWDASGPEAGALSSGFLRIFPINDFRPPLYHNDFLRAPSADVLAERSGL